MVAPYILIEVYAGSATVIEVNLRSEKVVGPVTQLTTPGLQQGSVGGKFNRLIPPMIDRPKRQPGNFVRIKGVPSVRSTTKAKGNANAQDNDLTYST